MADDTRAALLAETETLLRTRGYAGFSYADLADRVGIRKASIHHHFRTKEALGCALVDDYLARFSRELAGLTRAGRDAPAKLAAYASIFAGSLGERRLPLCGALAAELESMPEAMGRKTRAFFELHVEWLSGVFAEGVAAGDFRADLEPRRAARQLLSVLEGATLVGWVLEDAEQVASSFDQALESFRPPSRRARK